MKSYTLVVIGAGSGGLIAAEIAAKLGAKVALVEKNQRLGGECLHAGCVPSKALVAVSNFADSARVSKEFGVDITAQVDFAAVKRHIQSRIKAIENHSENDAHYHAMGIDVYHGAAQFTDHNTVNVGGEQVQAKKFIIATGSRAAIPPIPGLDSVPHSSNDTIFTIADLPKRLLVLGGGPIGCELGQAFQKLGSQVTIVQNGDRVLPREEPFVSATLQDEFTHLGMNILTNAKLESLQLQNNQVIAKTSRTDKHKTIVVDHVLLAAGRVANTDLNLDKAGIKTGERGITVNDRLQTSNRNVYAIGDCIGQYQFTHYAAEQAGLAVRNALFPFTSKQKNKAVPWVTFTTPEIGRLGATEDELKAADTAYTVHSLDYASIDKAVVENSPGSIKILTHPQTNKILGATVIGNQAGELINQIAMVYAQKRPFTDLGLGLRAYPNYSFGLKQLASTAQIDKAAKNSFLKFFRTR